MGAALLGVVGSALTLMAPAHERAMGVDRPQATAGLGDGVLPDLSSVDDAEGLGDGWVLVDGRERTLHVTDSSGNLLRRIGRGGQGPGEFQYPRLVAVTATRIYVAQLTRPELSEFDHEGRFTRLIRPSAPCGIGAPELLEARGTELVVLRRCTEPPRRIRMQLERMIDGELRPWGWADTIALPPNGQVPFTVPVLALDERRVFIGDGGTGCLRTITLADAAVSDPTCLTWIPRLVTPDSLREQLSSRARGRMLVPDSLPRILRLGWHGSTLAAMLADDADRSSWTLLTDSTDAPPVQVIGRATTASSFLSHGTQLIVTDTPDGIHLEVLRVRR